MVFHKVLLGPILLIIYILPIKSIFHKYLNIHYHMYADYLQIYSLLHISNLIQYIFNYITDLTEWLSNNSICLNITKLILSYSLDTVLLYQSLIMFYYRDIFLSTSQFITTLF